MAEAQQLDNPRDLDTALQQDNEVRNRFGVLYNAWKTLDIESSLMDVYARLQKGKGYPIFVPLVVSPSDTVNTEMAALMHTNPDLKRLLSQIAPDKGSRIRDVLKLTHEGTPDTLGLAVVHGIPYKMGKEQGQTFTEREGILVVLDPKEVIVGRALFQEHFSSTTLIGRSIVFSGEGESLMQQPLLSPLSTEYTSNKATFGRVFSAIGSIFDKMNEGTQQKQLDILPNPRTSGGNKIIDLAQRRNKKL